MDELTICEYNALSNYTHAIKLDSVVDVSSESEFYDFEEDETMSLQEGLSVVWDAIAYPLTHDISFHEATIIADMFERFGFLRPAV